MIGIEGRRQGGGGWIEGGRSGIERKRRETGRSMGKGMGRVPVHKH